VQTGQFTGTARISKAGRPLLRWAFYPAALGACRNPGWRARREGLIAKRHGDPHAFFKASTELAAKLLRLVWGIWRSGPPYDPARIGRGLAGGPAIAPAIVRRLPRGLPRRAGTGGDRETHRHPGRAAGGQRGLPGGADERRERGMTSTCGPERGSAHTTWRHREVTSRGTQARLSRFSSSDKAG